MKTTSTKKIATVGATIGILAALLAMSGALAPVLAATQQLASTTTSAVTSSSPSAVPSLSVGQVITITSTHGSFHVVGDKAVNGTASGTVALTVTGKFAGGYSVSITSGSLSFNGASYAVSSGSAEMGPYGHHMVGQGTTTTGSTATPGTFLFRATARGTFGGEYATMSLDLQTGATEYAISLVGSIQG
jgi:hypothetical protein